MAALKAAARPAAGAGCRRGDRLGLTMHALSDDERAARPTAVGMMVDAVHARQPRPVFNRAMSCWLNDTLLETPDDDIPTLEANGSVIAVLIQRNNARKFVSVRAR